VSGFAQAGANQTLLVFALREQDPGGTRAVDIGCGAGRNLVPLARLGWTVLGVDLSMPMLEAASARIRDEGLSQAAVALAPLDALPLASASVDLVIAHGIWNLARSAAEFRRGVLEAARVARDGAALFVFTFSRRTIAPSAAPVAGEPFVFTEFSGEPQCFLTEVQLREELAAAGFEPDAAVPLTEHNVPKPGALLPPRTPVIFEAAFRRTPRA
jgi:SAM-dependent methyltransferase